MRSLENWLNGVSRQQPSVTGYPGSVIGCQKKVMPLRWAKLLVDPLDLKFGTLVLLETSTRVQSTAHATHRYASKPRTKIGESLSLIDIWGRLTARGAARRTFSARSSVQETYKRSPLQHEGTATSSDGALSSGDGDGKSQQKRATRPAATPYIAGLAVAPPGIAARRAQTTHSCK